MRRIFGNVRPLDVTTLEQKGYTQVGRILGEGSYSKVRLATTPKGLQVAVKVIDRSRAHSRYVNYFLARELVIIRKIHHPNIIYVIDMFEVKNTTFVVSELAAKGDLQQYIALRGPVLDEPIPMARSKLMTKQLVQAIQYLHTLNIVHRDVKCENVLIDSQGNIKVTDFGFAREMKPNDLSTTYCGSPPYAAPELLQHAPYHGKSIDIWSLGVVLYILITGTMPFHDNDLKKMFKAQMRHKIAFPECRKVTDPAKDLIRKMLHPKVAQRLNIQQVQRSTWLKRTPWIRIAKDESIEELGAPLSPSSLPASTQSSTTSVFSAVAAPC